MSGSILSSVLQPRRKFDPAKKEDVAAFFAFRRTHKWSGGCPFYLEWPYVNIALMCTEKYVDSKVSSK